MICRQLQETSVLFQINFFLRSSGNCKFTSLEIISSTVKSGRSNYLQYTEQFTRLRVKFDNDLQFYVRKEYNQ